jgi:PAS domain S-box-containing protein
MPTSSATARNPTPPSGMRPAALVVEDEGLIARELAFCLGEMGFDVLAAADSNAALQAAQRRTPDVVLMDIHIKGPTDGIETAAMLREHVSAPVVFLTAYADEATVARAAKVEPYGYLIKPFTHKDVRSAVEIARHKHRVDMQLADRERWFSTTLRSIGDAVVACDSERRVRFLNRAAERLTGWTEADAAGHVIDDIVRIVTDDGDDDRSDAITRAMRKRTAQAAPSVASLVSRDGREERMIDLAAAPILNADTLLGAVVVFRDVTEQRRMQEQLAVTDRLTSLGTMAASMGHEINNPLSYNLTNIEFALGTLRELVARDSSPELADVIQALDDARMGSLRIASIVADLRRFSRSQEEVQREVDVRVCVEWALRLTANQLRHAAKLVTQLEEVPHVLGNDVRLSQVFVNLLSNASQAIVGPTANNEIRVVARTDPRGWALVEISDTGPGMPPEIVARVFDPFFTTKPAGVGWGLGLSICREIVAWMGGELLVTSEVGLGSTFSVALPPGASGRTTELPAIVEAEPTRSARILVIDDNELVGRAIGRMLEESHRVTLVGDGESALAIIEQGEEFDLVLCDMMMPGMTGMDLYEELAQRRPVLARRMVFMTGGAFTPRAAEFLATVHNPTISKPFTAIVLRATLHAHLATQDEVGPA